MKKNYSLLLVLLTTAVFGQIPANYYNTATGTGYALKTQLHNIIDGHTDRGYAGLYVTYTTSDKDFYYENNGTLLDIYSEIPSGEDSYEYTYGSDQQDDGSLGTAEGQRFNREHIVPQSYFASALPMYADAHFIVPTDKYVNGQRGNFPFGKVNMATLTTTNGSKKGANLNSGYSAGYTATVFEPIDEFKGDVARMILYFVTRYQGQLSGFYSSTNVSSTQSKAMFDGTEDHALSNTFLNILLTWHANDPVSQRELDRNNAIYRRQSNRNPYIDHPEYAAQIWGEVAGLNTFAANTVTVYPNPAVNHEVNIYSESPLENIEVINLNGQLIQSIQKPQATSNAYIVKNLSQGFYMLRATSGNQTVTKKIIVN
ncbi:ribonuclease [Flavobacterium rivuli WB 3.3-2 = DSM 21788]|uniref:Ribonuclease n=1 Tax=Flavobacterium rivuli WB 3.3-2 = DSM 21788 TaxID=1121895 RepID=A0A0A2M7W2_9FLAO|nr:endonuclease [Flavobacterium rivuli]KGO88737.1 ribonuclease [Flavobacterium rivuli WB 3.3-2 = DSM 21788]